MLSQVNNNNSYNRFNGQLSYGGSGVSGYYPAPLSVNTTKPPGLADFFLLFIFFKAST